MVQIFYNGGCTGSSEIINYGMKSEETEQKNSPREEELISEFGGIVLDVVEDAGNVLNEIFVESPTPGP